MTNLANLSEDCLKLLQFAARLCSEKNSYENIISSTTIFFAAVEWGEHGDAPVGLKRLSLRVRKVYRDGYAQLAQDFFRKRGVPPLSERGEEEALASLNRSNSVDRALKGVADESVDITAVELLWRLIIGDNRSRALNDRLVNMASATSEDATLRDPALDLTASMYARSSDKNAITTADRDRLRDKGLTARQLRTGGGEDEPPFWLAVYNPEEEPGFLNHMEVGDVEPWKISNFGPATIAKKMQPGDIVAIWLGKTGDPNKVGGLIGWARVEATATIESAEYFRFKIIDVIKDDPVARPVVIRLLRDVSSNWPNAGSLKGLIGHEADVFRALFPDSDFGFEANVGLNSDRPEQDRDLLNRVPLAFSLASLINEVYDCAHPTEETRVTAQADAQNLGSTAAMRVRTPRGKAEGWIESSDDAAFVVHIDSPWGGGKTTFANFVARMLNPRFHGVPSRNHRSKEKAASSEDGLFTEEIWTYWSKWDDKWKKRDWLPIHFNAWTNQHITPPFWNFYLNIRRQVFRQDWRRARARGSEPGVSLFGTFGAFGRCLTEPITEIAWRIFTPEFIVQFFAFVFLLSLVFWGLSEDFLGGTIANKTFIGDDGLTALRVVLGAGTGVAAIGAVRARINSVLLSASGSVDSANLGVADPVARFRDRFHKFVERTNRPLLIIIDDVDRCEPDCVVALMRGLITVFNSPRIVFMILGDKDWIDQSFAIAHEEMRSANDEGNVGFGARFSEKAMQMSFLLPTVDPETKKGFARKLLIDEGALEPEPNDAVQDVVGSLDENAGAVPGTDVGGGGVHEAALHRERNAKAVLTAAHSQETRKEISHALMTFVEYLPSNPRRIKRFVNLVGMYQASARITLNVQPDTAKWRQLVLWLLLMTEFPDVWKALVSDPKRLDAFMSEPGLAKMPNSDEESAAVTGPEISSNCLAILNGSKLTEGSVNLTKAAIKEFALLTPV